MAPKKATTGAAKAKSSSASAHPAYKEMIRDAIIKLKERNGSSRSKLKQYILANNKGLEAGPSFDSQFNKAVKSGVDKGEFAQPKGPSGTVKLAKKDATKPAAKKASKPAAKKATGTKKASTGAKKTKAAAPKKASKTGASKASKPKSAANTGAKRKSKATPSAAPAVVDEKKVLGKTKSGRVTKGPAKASNPAKKTKPAPKKKAAPKAA